MPVEAPVIQIVLVVLAAQRRFRCIDRRLVAPWFPMSEAMRHHDEVVDGVRVHWAELGPTSSPHPPLVLLHGIADSYLSWRPVAPLLAQDRHVLMPDLPGCGLSDRPDRAYGLSWETHMIARWMEALSLDTVDLVGHSYGGGVAQMLMLECPQRLRRVVLVASGGLGKEVGFWLRLAAFPGAVEWWGQPFMAFGTRRSLRHSQQEGARDDVRSLSRMNALPGTARAFSRMVRDVINWRGQTRLFYQRAQEIERFPPLAIFWGRYDAIIPWQQGRAFASLMEGSTLRVFEGAGHYVHHDVPEAFVEATRAFLDAPSATHVRMRARQEAALQARRGARRLPLNLRKLLRRGVSQDTPSAS